MPGIFWVVKKKTERIFWVVVKGLRDFFGYAKKVVIFWADKINSEVVIFLGIKYGHLSDPPLLKFMDGAPGFIGVILGSRYFDLCTDSTQ